MIEDAHKALTSVTKERDQLRVAANKFLQRAEAAEARLAELGETGTTKARGGNTVRSAIQRSLEHPRSSNSAKRARS
ncbi:MAG TPA: hypothetical protein VFB25_10835 [Gaiellaceae bacterium]|nr:hypothetical protein [Gaiellaceae bacterium]